MASYEILMARDVPPLTAMFADKGYDSDAIRTNLEMRGIAPVIPTKVNRRAQRPVDKPTYALRKRIERFIKKLKHSRRVATPYDKLPRLREGRDHAARLPRPHIDSAHHFSGGLAPLPRAVIL